MFFDFKPKFHPLVSIVIPVYNGSNFVREAIDSALAQTYDNIEVIVVNDGSTDNTEEIVKSYGDKIRYFSKKNGGVSTALNLAIKKSRGDYISWLSHDDVYDKRKIEIQVKGLNKIDSIDRENTIFMSNFILIDERSKIIGEWRIHRTHNLNKFKYPLYPVVKGIVNGCTLLIPKFIFKKYGYFDISLKTSQDYEMWLKIFPKCKIIFQKDYLLKSRQHSTQGTSVSGTYLHESNIFWIKLIKQLSVKEKVEISGSEEKFEKEMRKQMKDANYFEVVKFLDH